MNKSDRTKQCKRLSILFTILHFLFVFGPLLFFVPYGFSQGEPIQSVSLSLTLVVSACLSVYMIFCDASRRGGLTKSIMWILIIGILFCLTEVKTFIYIMAIVSIIDELVIVKLRAKYKDAYAANKEIDRRQ